MYLKNLKILAASSIVLISACDNNAETQSSVLLEPPDVEPINTKPVNFKVINNKTISQLDIQNKSWYSLDAQNYENLAYNMQEILRYLKQQQATITYYRRISSGPNKD